MKKNPRNSSKQKGLLSRQRQGYYKQTEMHPKEEEEQAQINNGWYRPQAFHRVL